MGTPLAASRIQKFLYLRFFSSRLLVLLILINRAFVTKFWSTLLLHQILVKFIVSHQSYDAQGRAKSDRPGLKVSLLAKHT